MKKISLFGTALLLSAGIASAQLTNSLNISTGFDNVTSSTIANGAQDDDWQVTSLAAPFSPVSGMPYNAYAQNPWTWATPLPTTPAGTKWISYDATAMSTGIPDNSGTGRMTLRFQFEMCSEDEITIDAIMRSDNYISDIEIDGSSTGYVQTNTTANWTTGSNFNYPVTLGPGVHTIDVYIVNSGSSGNNPSGMNVSGTITGTTNSIIDRHNYPDYVCTSCEDGCFWKVTGNNITNGNNIFGTLTDDDVRIKTANTFRGRMDVNGQFGWNTMSPTAYLHVLCAGNNPDDGGAGSDIRFERLEHNFGHILVIDEEGYVYNSRVRLNENGEIEGVEGADGKKMQEMESRMAELEAQLQKVSSLLSADAKNSIFGSRLEQNAPNPTGGETVIRYYVQSMQQNAQVVVTDFNGRKIAEYPVTTGAGSVTVEGNKLASGTYMYSLVIDGRQIDSKKMTVANK